MNTTNEWVEIVGRPEGGLWCVSCALPTGVIVHVAVGVSCELATIWRCFLCPECSTFVVLGVTSLDHLRGGPVELSWKERCGSNA